MEFSKTKAWVALEMLAGRGMPAAPFRGLGCCPGLTLDRQSLSVWRPFCCFGSLGDFRVVFQAWSVDALVLKNPQGLRSGWAWVIAG